MPVTKTAKRALRGSKRKGQINKSLLSKLEIAVRMAQKSKKEADVKTAISLADRADKKKIFHKNKVGRIKSSLSKILLTKKSSPSSSSDKKKKTTKK